VAVFIDSSSNYGRGVLEGTAEYLETHGPWSVFLKPHAIGPLNPAWLRRWTGDGIIAFVEHAEIAHRLCRRGIPVVEVYGHLPDLGVPSFGSDDEAIGRLAAEHLLDRGFSKFAFVGYPKQSWSVRRQRGFAATVSAVDCSCEIFEHPRAFDSLSEWERSQERLTHWLLGQPRPLGVMACSDRQAQRVLDACRRIGLAIPDELAVIGVDNDQVLCQLADPPLSSVADNPAQIGYEAAELLDAIMSGKRRRTDAGGRLIPPRGVVTRRSTDVTVADDSIIAAALSFIREHACEDINATSLSRRFPLSRSAFYRRFVEATRRTPHEEILRTRIERAQQLLTDTDRPVAEIARLTGFEYPEYLGAVFKRRTGMSPGEFRERQRPRNYRRRD
jgi:LacI family transcriptional regulator